MKKLFLCIAVVLVCTPNNEAALFDWLFGKDESENEEITVKSSRMKFEVSVGDQRFMQLKDVLDNMSPLDACYNIVSRKLQGHLTHG